MTWIVAHMQWIMLVSGALTCTMLYAAVSKVAFIGLVLAHGSRYLGQQVGIAVAIDALTVALYVTYAIAKRRMPTSRG